MTVLMVVLLLASACDTPKRELNPEHEAASMVNFDHLDHLGEQVPVGSGSTARLIHIYAEAPDYGWVGDDDEGIAAVDDAARAAVVYLRAFELRGDEAARSKAEDLIRFILYMQTDDGLFYNFVWNNELEINETHQNSRADRLEWWTCRAVWALGVAAEVLKLDNPELSEAAAAAVRRVMLHVEELLANYPRTRTVGGRLLPTWLVSENASDATSELLLGLSALNRAYPDPALADAVARLGEGVAMMQWGDMSTFPFAAHGSWEEGWHAWGNSQTQALSEMNLLASAEREARSFYSRLLVNGWMHSFEFDRPGVFRQFEQIAYGVRCVSVGLIRLYEATGDADYLIMAGLAASWFTGNNVGGFEMYDPETGRGYDGIGSPTHQNLNAGAESTIEALYTVLEVERYPESAKWMHAAGREQVTETRDGLQYIRRTFVVEPESESHLDNRDSVAVVMNLTGGNLRIVKDDEFSDFFTSR